MSINNNKDNVIENKIMIDLNNNIYDKFILFNNNTYQINIKAIKVVHKELHNLIINSNFQIFENKINQILLVQNEYCSQIPLLDKCFIFNNLKDLVSCEIYLIKYFFL